MVWWLAPSPHSESVPGSTPGWGLSVFPGFLPPSKNMHVRLIGVSKIVPRSEHGCVVVCLICLCGPVMDWRPVQGVHCLLLDDRWDRPHDPTNGL